MADWGLVAAGPASRAYGDQAEVRAKLSRLRAAMGAAEVEAVYLEAWTNVAWVTGGRGNRVVLDSLLGLCGILVTESGAWLLVPNNEEARVRAEPFADLPLPVVVRPWYQLPLWQSARAQVPSATRWATDAGVPGWVAAEPLLAPDRRRLGEADASRYRALGLDAAEGLETALLEAREGWSELEVAGTMAAALKARDIEAGVVLVGTRARAERFRHLVPTQATIEGGLIASVTAERHGLHASVTRCISFGATPAELLQKHATVVAVDRAYLAASRPGVTLGDAFRAGEQAYAAGGFYDDWKEHHQGGTTGYTGREVFAKPDEPYTLEEGMATAWNPTVPGAKSEDTYLITGAGLEWLTRNPGSEWPLSGADEDIPRVGILARRARGASSA
ncbi:MAG: M24 family metallopeptidase [Candidatus Dormibacteraeota bacterium]|nr:M24 family metallopeptidase [Candidatus Dormibacteraeota bacterium]